MTIMCKCPLCKSELHPAYIERIEVTDDNYDMLLLACSYLINVDPIPDTLYGNMLEILARKVSDYEKLKYPELKGKKK